MAYCDFCTCGDCQKAAEHLKHAQTEDGRWICNVDYFYECCLNAGAKQPCAANDPNCPHRPKLVTGWTKD